MSTGYLVPVSETNIYARPSVLMSQIMIAFVLRYNHNTHCVIPEFSYKFLYLPDNTRKL